MLSVVLLDFFFVITKFVLNVYADIVVNLTAIATTENGVRFKYLPLINDFNEYSKNNGLNIYLDLTLFSKLNSTGGVEDYEAMLDSMFSKRPDKYDLIFYDHIYTTRFGPHLLNLKEILPQDHIDMYMEGIASQTCVYKDKIVGFPTTIDYSVFYYNKQLLDQYNQIIPKTWDQVIAVGEYIKNELDKQNINNIMIYNGGFNLVELGFCSLYEFLYSFRKNETSPFPEITSDEAVEALEKIKEIMNKLSSASEFKSNEEYAIGNIHGRNYLFGKFWYMDDCDQPFRAIPGNIEGISGSVIGGHNIGINKHSDLNKRDAVVKAFTYFTSKDIQRKYFALKNYYSPIPSLYDEEEVCQAVDCNHYKNIQLIKRPFDQVDDYNTYTNKFRTYIYEYLYGDDNIKAIDALKKVEDITKIYYFSLNTDDSSIGLILFIIVTIIIVIMLGSLVFLYIEKLKSHYKFLPNDFWIFYIIGLVFILCPYYIEIGKVSSTKCFLKIVFMIVGYTICYIPLISQMIIQIPKEGNEISQWVNQHRYLFIGIFLLFDLILIFPMCFTPYTVMDMKYQNQKNFQICKQNYTFGKLIIILIYIYICITIIVMFFLIFLEWNFRPLRYDVRFLTSALYMNIVLFTMYILISNIVTLNNYIVNSLVREIPRILFVFVNYIFVYGYRSLGPLIKKKIERESNSNNKMNVYRYYSSSTSRSRNTNPGLKSSQNVGVKTSLSQQIMDIHNKKELGSETSVMTSSSSNI